ncbi:MAG: hypothetical protein IIC75_08830 [Bacteroidetes bacterium]|nr:hypothetical protein [Bacteroidota bacterium]
MEKDIIKKDSATVSNVVVKKKDSLTIVILREIIACVIWLYLFIKIFVYDIDLYFLNLVAPELIKILNYKFFIYIGLIALTWLILGNKRFSKLVAVIVFFPVIFLFWRIPKLFWKSKSWIGVFASIGILFTFFSSLKLNFMIFALVSISILLITISSNSTLLFISMLGLFIYLIHHYIKKFIYAFKPSHIFTIQSDAINNFWETIKKNFKLSDDIKGLEVDNLNDAQQDKFCTNLQFVIIINRILYFVTEKLKKFQKSGLNVVYYFISIFFTIFTTIFIFALQNFALYKIDPASFSSAPKGNFFFFIYYSFNTLFTNSINDFYPISDYSRLLNSFEIFLAFVILAILLFLVTTIVRDKHNEEISTAIVSINNKGKEMENVIYEDYKMDISQAIKFVESVQGNMIRIIYYFSKNIDDDRI